MNATGTEQTIILSWL